MLQRVAEVSPSLTTTFNTLISECTLGIWNKTTVETLISILSEPDLPPELKSAAHIPLKDLAIHLPKLFKNMLVKLANFIVSEAELVSENRNTEDKQAVENVLKTISRLDDIDLPVKQAKPFVDALKKFALEGETEKQGRRATVVLLKLKRRSVYADDLVNVTSRANLSK
jgi:hypothetical protein